MQSNTPEANTREYFRCPVCGQTQPFLCPGFDQHSPAQTLIYHNNHIQCALCMTTLSQVTCSICNAITFLTPDIAADPFGRSYSPDFKQMEKFLEIGYRYMEVITHLQQIGPVDESKIVEELKSLLTDCEDLLAALPRKYPSVNPNELRWRIADIASWIGIAYDSDSLLDNEQAILYSQRAAHTYEQLGEGWKADECYQYIARIKLRDEGVIDDEVERLHSQIADLPDNSLRRIHLLRQLGSLHMQVGDDFEAEKVLLTAEKRLKSLQLTEKDGTYRADVLIDAGFPVVAGIFANASILEEERKQLFLKEEEKKRVFLEAKLHNLHFSLYDTLSTLYRERDFSRMSYYFEIAKQGTDNEKTHALLQARYSLDVLHHTFHLLQGTKVEQHILELVDLLEKARYLEYQCRNLPSIQGTTASLVLQGKILISLQQYDEAIAVLLEAQRTLKGHWEHDREVQILAKLVEAYGHKELWEKASSLCEEGINLVEKYRYKVTGPYMQSAYLTSRIGLYSWGTRAAYELGDYNLMLQRAELSKARSLLRYQREGNGQVSSPAIQQIEKQFRHVCEQIDTAGLDDVYLDELRQKRRTLWDLLTVQRFQSRTGKNLPVFHLEAVQATLTADEAILYYYWFDSHTLLITVLDQHRLIPVVRLLTSEQQTSLQASANFVLQLTEQSAVSHLDSVQTFSSLLLPEEAAPLLEEKQRLLFSPHRLLHALPFHALQWKNNYLIERFAVTYIPNLSSLLYTHPPVKPQRVLAVGIQEYAVLGHTLRPLKTAEQEVEDLQQLAERTSIPIMALKGPEARIEQVRQLATTSELSQFTRLHFATHGSNINSDTPMESFLFLRDSLLDGLEIASWQLQADVVVLSACCSGQRPISGRHMKELPGDELFGLQSAFFTAGAKSILSCLWPVDDTVASQMTKIFHQLLMNGQPPEVALQLATKEYLKGAGLRTRKIYYWAPFFLSAMGRLEHSQEESTDD